MLLVSGRGVWKPRVEAPLYRKVAEGTVEDGLLRKILQEVDSSTIRASTIYYYTILYYIVKPGYY